MTRLDRKLAWSIFALCFFSYLYFYQGGGWNENSRVDLVRALADDHSLSIDRYEANTGDKAIFRDHYYSDKAPGLSFLATPIYFVVRALRPLFSSEHDFVVVASALLTWLTVSIAGALTAVLVYRVARRLPTTPAGALVAALAYGLGSPAFPLSTMFFSHQLSALILAAIFFLATDETDGGTRRTVIVALLAASSVLVEYPTFPAAAGLALYQIGPRFSRRTWIALGVAALPGLLLVLYLAAAFGSPFRVGYDLLSNPGAQAEMHSHGLFGITYPKLQVIASLLIGRTRGLLPYSPVLFLGVFGFIEVGLGGGLPGAMNGSARTKIIARLALAVVAYFVLFVGSYEWWQGGASFGSRHLAAMLPFLCVPIALVASRRPTLGVVLLALSAAGMLVVTSVHPKPSEWIENPFWSFLMPAFVKGHLALTKACPMFGNPGNSGHHSLVRTAPYDAFNLGMVIGGRGLKSLVPLLGVWGTSAWALSRELGAGAENPSTATVADAD